MYQQSSGSITELTFEPDEHGAFATGISDTGVIVGYAYAPSPVPGYWTTTGGAVVLSSPQYCFPTDANDTGIIVASCGNSGSPGAAAYTWSGPGYSVETLLPTLLCNYCARIPVQANGVNGPGLIVGMSAYSVGDNAPAGNHAVEWNLATVIASCATFTPACQAAVTDLDPADTSDSVANAINNSTPALIVGTAGNHATSWMAPGEKTDLGTLPGDNQSSADAVSDAGEIVGKSQNAGGSSRAFVYVNGQMYDLNALIDPTTPLPPSTTLADAVSINSNGWIAVNATIVATTTGDNGAPMTQTTSAPHAYLLVPNH